MSVPSQTAIAAACVVDPSATPAFMGIGNQGFLPFGADDANHSYRVSAGDYKMRMLVPVDLAGGAGLAIATLAEPYNVAHIIVYGIDPTDQKLVHVLTNGGAGLVDLPFGIVVFRFPQSLEG